MTEHYRFDQDLREAEAMVKALENYLMGAELYTSIGGGFLGFGDMPALTVGALLMRLRRMQALRMQALRMQLNPEQRERLAAIVQEHARIRAEWRVHYDKKILYEANSRLDAMRPYFAEAAQSMEMAANAYKPEQLRRTIVEDILVEMQELDVQSADLDAKVREIDSRLSNVSTQPTDFLWDPQLEPAYPKKEYWWLYRKPRTAHL